MQRGDVVLINVPFVGTLGSKTRPALILQNDTLNAKLQETVIAEITSNLKNVSQPHQVLIDVSTTEGAATGLLADSSVRCERLHTVPQADVKRVIGRVSPRLVQLVETALKSALALQ